MSSPPDASSTGRGRLPRTLVPRVPRIPAGTDRRRLAWSVVGGIVGLVVGLVFIVWMTRNEGQRITATTVGYRVVDDTSVTVSFDVSRPPGLAVTCTVRATDGHFTPVGSAMVPIPVGGDQVVHQEATVRTTTRAVTGVVQDCVRT